MQQLDLLGLRRIQRRRQQLNLRGLFRVRPIRQQLNPWGLFRVRQRRLPARRLSPFGSISLCETALAGRCPRRGQRARYPIFALLKCGPAYSRGVCRGTFPCSTAGPALAPRRSAPFHPKTIVRFRMSVSPEFSVFFICPPPFFCIGSGAHRYTKIRGGDTPPRI